MAKKNTNLFGDIASSIGVEVLDNRDYHNWIDTGILALNFICSGKFIGGGIPSHAAIEIFGNSSSSKTVFGTKILAGTQRGNGIPVFLDAEGTLNKDFAFNASGLDPSKCILIPAEKIPSLERAFNAIHKTIRCIRQEYKVPIEQPIVFVYDSIAASPSERELAETTLDLETATKAQMDKAGAGADKPGERAKISSKELRKLVPVLEQSNSTVIFINQIREKIGGWAPAGAKPETTGGGGRSLEFYCSLRLNTKARKRFQDSRKNFTGVRVNATAIKNKCYKPFGEVTDLMLLFDKGINPLCGLLDILYKAERINSTSAGRYIVLDPWADGAEIKFQATKEQNMVPLEVLLKAPKLIDANTAEEVQYYIESVGGLSGPTDINEIDTETDDEDLD